MEIGFDATNILGHGGVKTYSRELLRALAKVHPDHRFHLFTTSSRRKKEKLENEFTGLPGIQVHGGLPHALMLGEGLRSLSGILGAAYWALAGQRLDLVHMTDPYSCAAVPGNFVVTIHDLFPLSREEFHGTRLERFYRRMTPGLLRKARRIITPSRFTAESIAELFPDCRKPVDVIPEAASGRFRPVGDDGPLPGEYGLGGCRYFLFIGRVDGRKNIDGIVEGFLQLLDEEPEAHLVLVLSGGSRLEDLPETRNLHVIGSAPDQVIPMLYSRAEAFVFPSLDEGFGLPVLEAMQCGCPVITSSRGSIPEVAGDAALFVDPLSTHEIASAMSRLWHSETLRDELRRPGLERAGEFSWERTAELTMTSYRKAAGGNGEILQ